MKMNSKIVNENMIVGSDLKRIDLLMEVGKAICKISIEECVGSGFLIKLYKEKKPFYCLMTNEHVLEKRENEIDVLYANQKNKLTIKLDGSDKRFIRDYKYMGIDLIIIEILSQDLVDEVDLFNDNNSFFLSPNVDYNDKGGYEKYINRNIYILQYPEGGSLSVSDGIIESIENYYFTHKASTKSGSSGSPIFLKNSSFVLGVHQAGFDDDEKNLGFFLGPVIESFKRNFNVGKKSFGEDIYEGEFNNDKREGYGKYTYKNGNYYIGEWLNDKKNGKGIVYNKKNCILYRGNYKDDIREKSEFPHEHPLNYKEVLNENCKLCSEKTSGQDGYKCEECSIVLCPICAGKVLYEEKNKSIHGHDLALKYRENWKCDGCKKMKRGKASFYCKSCKFDACEKCYFQNKNKNKNKNEN